MRESLDFGTPSDIPANANNWKMASTHWRRDYSGSTLSTSPYVCGDSCWHTGIHKWDPGRRKCEVRRPCNEKTFFSRSGPHTCLFVLLFIFCMNKDFQEIIYPVLESQDLLLFRYMLGTSPLTHTHIYTYVGIYIHMYYHIYIKTLYMNMSRMLLLEKRGK